MGRVKEGRGTFLGNAGEHFVVAELLRREVIAAPALARCRSWSGRPFRARYRLNSLLLPCFRPPQQATGEGPIELS